MALVLEFIRKISKGVPKILKNPIFEHRCPGDIPVILKSKGDKYVVTTGSHGCDPGKVILISEPMLQTAFYYYAYKASKEVVKFLDKNKYVHISKEIDGVLYILDAYYLIRILVDILIYVVLLWICVRLLSVSQ